MVIKSAWLDAFDRQNFEDVQKLYVINPMNIPVEVVQFATVQQDNSPSLLERKDRQQAVTLTALVYPTFLSTIAQATSPTQRAESIGTFRLWRDLGYAFGAIISGVMADVFGIEYAVFFIGGVTIISSFIIKFRMPEQTKQQKTA